MPLCPRDVTFGDPLLDDFRNFLCYTLRRLKGVDPSPNQYDGANFLWRAGVDDPDRYDEIPDKRMLEALRGFGKSTVAHIYLPWEGRRAYEYTGGRPDCHLMIVSGTKDLADAAARFMRDLIETDPFLRCLAPKDPDEKWSGVVMNFNGRVPAAAPSIFARGLMGRMTGDRADLILFDDIEIPANAETQVQREKLRTRAQEFVDVLTPGGQMIGLGTPQVEDTVYNEIEGWGFARMKIPARYPDPTWMAKLGQYLSPRLARNLEEDRSLEGRPTEPRFDEEVLRKREMVSRSRFQLQNMLDTSLADEDRYPLKLRDLVVVDLEPLRGPESASWTNDERRRRQDLPCVGLTGDAFYGPRDLDAPLADYDYRVLAVDPSGRGADETAFAVGAASGGLAYLLEVEGLYGDGYGPAVMGRICDAAARYGVHCIIVEDNFGGGMFENLLGAALHEKVKEVRAGGLEWAGASIESVHHTINKEHRIIDTLEPVMNQHRLLVASSVVEQDRPGRGEAPETYRLFHQMTRIQRVKGALTHYDRLDAVAMLVAHLTDRMGLTAATTRDRRVLEEERAMWAEYRAHNQLGGMNQPARPRHRNPALKNRDRLRIGRRPRPASFDASYTVPFTR